MKYKLLTAAISIVCVFMMTATTFQPVAANRGADGTVMHPDTFVDGDGNTHMVYSQLVRYYVNVGNQQVPKWQAEVFYKNNVDIVKSGNSWNSPIQISDSISDSLWPQVSVDSSTGIIYVSWTEESRHDNKFWYAGSSDGGASFTVQRYGASAPWPVAPNQNMVASEGILTFSWAPSNSLELVADIDGDMIPDFHDIEPMIYNTDNFAIDIKPDVVATDNDLGVTVAIDYGGEDDTFPTVTSATGDFALSTGDYIEINLETDAEFSAIIKMPYSEVPPALNEECLRMYRQVGDDWVAVTDWELEEFTGINTEHGYVWAYVKHFSTFTTADASLVDGDGDGLTDLTEDTEPSSILTIPVTESNFSSASLSTNPSEITYFTFEIEPYNNLLAKSGLIEISSTAAQPIEDLELDIGDDGTIDWRALIPFEGTLRFGSFTDAISDYLFKNHLNNNLTSVQIPFMFTSSIPGTLNINYAQIEIEDVTTWNYEADTSGDGLFDGWDDKNDNFDYEREGVDSELGTDTDEIPGALALNLDPREKNVVGSSGQVAWNEFQEGINQVNGNLALTNPDLGFQALGHTIMLERTYNSLNSEINGPFGYGWNFNYGEKLQIGERLSTSFDMSDEGFAVETDRTYSIVKWDDINGRVYFKSDRRDAGDEMITKALGKAITSNDEWELSARTMISEDGNWVHAFPLFISDASRTSVHGANSIYFYWLDDDTTDSTTALTGNTFGGRYIDKDGITRIDIKIRERSINVEYHLKATYNTQTLTLYIIDSNNIILTSGSYTIGTNPNDDFTLGKVGVSSRGTSQYADNVVVGWTDDIDYVIGEKKFRDGYVEFIAGDGSYYDFEDLRDGTYSSPPGANVNLIYENGIYKLRYTDGLMKIFNDTGRLQEIQDKNGNSLWMLYDINENLIRVEDNTGLFLDFIYTNGLITMIEDSAGRTNTYTYDVNGNLITRTDAMGNEYRYDYYTSVGLEHKISTVINPLGMYKEYQYSGAYPFIVTGCTVGEFDFATSTKSPSYVEYEANYTYPSHTLAIDANGHESKRIFDKHGAAIEVQNPDGSSIAKEYDNDLNLAKETDALGNDWENNYDPLGNQVEQKDPTGNASATEFENVVTADEYVSLPTKTIDKNGAETTYAYDENRNPSAMTDPEGQTTDFEFTSDGLLQNQTRPDGAVTRYTYDVYGNVIIETDALGNTITYYYDAINRKTGMMDVRGFTTQYQYDALGRTVSITDPMGNVETYVYDALGNTLGFIDRTGATTTYAYDVFGRKISETDALNHTAYFEYDLKGNMVEETDKRGNSTHYVYDEMDRLVSVTDALGFYENYTYDANGNQLEKFDKLGNRWYKYYDELGRVTHDFCPYDVAIRYEYDAEGQMTKRIDRLNYQTIYEYDGLGNRVRELGAAGSDTRYAYDSVGNLMSVSQFDGDLDTTWQYDYDLLGRKVGEITPLGFVYSWEYDETGNLIEYIDANGQNTSYKYDALNRLTNLTMPGANLQGDYQVNITYLITESEREDYGYPPIMVIYGLPVRMMPMPPRMHTMEKEYDMLGRLVREMWAITDIDSFQVGSTNFYNITYEYDTNGNVIQMTDQFGLITTYTYDALNRLQTLTDPDGDTTTYEYDPIGQLTRTTYPTGTMIFQTYNKANLLTKIENVRSNWTIISSFTYGYNFNANRVSMTEANGATTYYAYDMENRLTGVTYPDGTQTQYQYDLRNNLVQT
ncbi:MAG: hypothetical protein KJ773_01670, partial [Candidatus Thermoplasmatota archaeon]|nr:hypothetical protein [Candidatus Thermoplasmatota archaeon]